MPHYWARELSNVDTAPEMLLGETRHVGSTPQVRFTSLNAGTPGANPFKGEEADEESRELQRELLSFATRPDVPKPNEVIGKDDSPRVGPWPLQRESRLMGDEVLSKPPVGKPRRPTITPDRYNGRVP